MLPVFLVHLRTFVFKLICKGPRGLQVSLSNGKIQLPPGMYVCRLNVTLLLDKLRYSAVLEQKGSDIGGRRGWGMTKKVEGSTDAVSLDYQEPCPGARTLSPCVQVGKRRHYYEDVWSFHAFQRW